MSEETQNREHWYAIRVTYCRELAVKRYLDEHGTENYLPMHWVEKSYAGRKRKVQVPLIHNLIFIRASAEELRGLKTETDLPVCYIMDRSTKSPLVVPESQMNDFIAVVSAQKAVEILPPHSIDLTDGDRVQVTEGPFRGIEGIYIRNKGRGRVAVAIHDVATALTAYIPMKYIQKIESSC